MSMKKLVVVGVVLLAGVAVGILLFSDRFDKASDQWTTRDMFVSADQANFDIGSAVGSSFPGLRATYDGREITLIDEFAGSNGTIVLALRSVDWCPYCKRQVLQLQGDKAFFDAAGIGLVAITYDPPHLQAPFIDRHGITIPLLSDTETLSFRTLGILNEEYEPGHSAYGISHPGMIIVDRTGEVVGKLFVESPLLRVESREALRYARRVLDLRAPFEG